MLFDLSIKHSEFGSTRFQTCSLSSSIRLIGRCISGVWLINCRSLLITILTDLKFSLLVVHRHNFLSPSISLLFDKHTISTLQMFDLERRKSNFNLGNYCETERYCLYVELDVVKLMPYVNKLNKNE